MITHAWRIIHIQGDRVLLCLLCDRYSWNMHDIANRYCGFCHEWLDIVPEDYRRMRRRSEEAPPMTWLTTPLTFMCDLALTALAVVIAWLTLPLLAIYAWQLRRRKQDP